MYYQIHIPVLHMLSSCMFPVTKKPYAVLFHSHIYAFLFRFDPFLKWVSACNSGYKQKPLPVSKNIRLLDFMF